ncbi:MAG TPA: AMP-binding protein [Acidimicrobiales bacterium]|nr:AMP-binding protein [Acidimicrobiales bacterium]
MPMLLHDVLDQAAARRPGALALVHAQGSLTFDELSRRAARLSAALGRLVPPGAPVAIVGDNGPEWVEGYYGVPAGGHVLAMVNHRLAPAEQAAVVEAAGARAVLGSPDCLSALLDGGHLPSGVTGVAFGPAYERFIAGEGPTSTAVDRQSGPVDPDGPAWLIFTSGTTGRPKGVQLSHRNLLTGALTNGMARGVADDDVYLYPFPLCHVAGHNVISYHLRSRPVVLVPRYRTDAFCDAVARHRVTAASLAPTMIHSLVEEAGGGDRSKLRSLRSLSYGSAPITPTLLQRTVDLLGDVDLSQGYGMTETAGNVSFLGPDDHRRGFAGDVGLLSTAGRPGPLVQLRIVDPDGAPSATGQVGEVTVHGDQVHLGYWGDPAATEEATLSDRSGRRWLRTGDLGRVDAGGRLTIVDRLKDIIVTGGENVSTREVEDVLSRVPGVMEVAVVGVPDPHWGESVGAAVVVRPGAGVTATSVRSFARQWLSGFKTPRRVVVVPRLPRNALGKVAKAELRAILADGDRLPGR